MSELSKYSLDQLIDELESRGYDFLEKVDDRDLEYECEVRDLWSRGVSRSLEDRCEELESRLDKVEPLEDLVIKLFYDYVQYGPKSEMFQKELKAFFLNAINEYTF